MKKDRKLLEERIRNVIDSDLPWARIQVLMTKSGKKELVKHCIEKYENSFDLIVSSFGNSGADEIAWAEIMRVLQFEDNLFEESS
jgi:hypothetical protein